MDGLIKNCNLSNHNNVIYQVTKSYYLTKSEMTAEKIQRLYADIRTGGISLPQVQAAISFVCLTDKCDHSELMDLLNEMDRRYFLIQDLRWEFSFFDYKQRDSIPEKTACWLVMAVHGDMFLERQWLRFIKTRCVPGSDVTFPEIEVMLCDIPSGEDIRLEKREEERERQDKLRRDIKFEKATEEKIDLYQKEIIDLHLKEKQKMKQEEEARKKRQTEEEERLRQEEIEERQRHKVEAVQLAKEQNEIDDVNKLAQEFMDMEHEAEEELKFLQEEKNKAKNVKLRKEVEISEAAMQKKKNESKQKRIRYQLKVAIQAKDKFKLEYSVKEFKIADLDDSDMDLAKAERLIKEFNAKDNLKQAMTKRDIEELEHAMLFVRGNGFETELHKEMMEASGILQRLKRLERIRHEILELKQSTVAEIRSYQNPPVIVHTVMTATLLLLGHKEGETKNWKTVQALIGRTGKLSLKRLCLESDQSKLNMQTAERSKQLLESYEIDSVRDVSAGAATFYIWAITMIEEAQELATSTTADRMVNGGQAPSDGVTPTVEMTVEDKKKVVAVARQKVTNRLSKDMVK